MLKLITVKMQTRAVYKRLPQLYRLYSIFIFLHLGRMVKGKCHTGNDMVNRFYDAYPKRYGNKKISMLPGNDFYLNKFIWKRFNRLQQLA